VTESAFLDALAADPSDYTTQLVYADWLEERGDPRAAYVRADAALATIWPEDEAWLPAAQALAPLALAFDRDWLQAVSTPYDIALAGYEPTLKISAIKLIRELTAMGLAEAKAFSEAALPRPLLQGLSALAASILLRRHTPQIRFQITPSNQRLTHWPEALCPRYAHHAVVLEFTRRDAEAAQVIHEVFGDDPNLASMRWEDEQFSLSRLGPFRSEVQARAALDPLVPIAQVVHFVCRSCTDTFHPHYQRGLEHFTLWLTTPLDEPEPMTERPEWVLNRQVGVWVADLVPLSQKVPLCLLDGMTRQEAEWIRTRLAPTLDLTLLPRGETP
jgi:uncharacterized protein (TIGR02996 family)